MYTHIYTHTHIHTHTYTHTHTHTHSQTHTPTLTLTLPHKYFPICRGLPIVPTFDKSVRRNVAARLFFKVYQVEGK